jgi:hypothetical protein
VLAVCRRIAIEELRVVAAVEEPELLGLAGAVIECLMTALTKRRRKSGLKRVANAERAA